MCVCVCIERFNKISNWVRRTLLVYVITIYTLLYFHDYTNRFVISSTCYVFSPEHDRVD